MEMPHPVIGVKKTTTRQDAKLVVGQAFQPDVRLESLTYLILRRVVGKTIPGGVNVSARFVREVLL